MQPPVFLHTFADPPHVDELDGEQLTETIQQADLAFQDASHEAQQANRYAKEANEAQIRAHSRNAEIMEKFSWSRPKNWRVFPDKVYHGYCKKDSRKNIMVRHGEGESFLPSGAYRYANYAEDVFAGLVLEHYPNGSEFAGQSFDAEKTAQMRIDDKELQAVFIGRYEDGVLNLGCIQFPDRSVYYGYCGFFDALEHMAPGGFGFWDSGHSLVVRGFFQEGFVEGVAAVQTPKDCFGAVFSAGRLVERGPSIVPTQPWRNSETSSGTS